MPVIMVNDQQYTLRPGATPGSAGEPTPTCRCRRVTRNIGVQAIVELAGDQQAVIRRHGPNAAVRVNGVALVDPTPLIHGDKVEIAGKELFYSDDTKAGATSYVSKVRRRRPCDTAKRGGPARATAATGGRLVSLVDGKEYTISATGITIGRDATSAVVVAQNEVSRSHAEVAPVAKGYEVRDLSANGVFVNGTRVENKQLLSRADIIRIGTEEFRFYADVPVAAPPARNVAPASAAAPAQPAPVSAPGCGRRQPPGPRGVGRDERKSRTMGAAATRAVRSARPSGACWSGARTTTSCSMNDDSVSETHAKLHWRDDAWYVFDLGSTNGTYVGGERLSARAASSRAFPLISDLAA